jgi:hypothetical protein
MSYLDPVNYERPYASGINTSEEAARKAARFVCQQGRDVLAWLQTRGSYGATQKEACIALGISRQSACGRFHALEQQGKIRKTTARRSGCVAYEVV